jgi:two-component system NtrC family sensor kinase
MGQGAILLVDDEPGLLDVLEWELSSLGYDVLAVGNGTSAVQVLERNEFDVVISDVKMPGLTGIDVLKRTKALCPDTEVIITTGFAEMETVVDCVRGGAFDFVQKPFNLPSVMATVGRALERKRLRTMAQMYESSLAISANRDAARLAELIIDAALKIVGCDAAALWQPGRDGLSLVHRKVNAGHESIVPRVNIPAMERVAAMGRPKVLPQDAGGDQGLLDIAPATSLIIYPLMVGGRCAGVLTCARFTDPRPFRRSDVERASVLAAQVTLALENERLLKQSVANERLASIGQLAAGVAHEINNPVSYVLMSLESATELSAELQAPGADGAELWPEMRSVLKDAFEGAGRIRDIVGDLRNMSRADTRERRRLDVNEVVRAALRIAGAELRHKTKVVVDLGTQVEVEGDAGKLTQVLVNLAVNAAQAMPARPVDVNEVTVRSWRDGEQVRVSVSDNGPGIPVENHERVFEAFFTTKAPGVGTGLGLPISRDIVRAHGGDLVVSTAAQGGACFTVTLPAAAKQAVAA